MEFVRRGTTKRNASNAIAITNRLEGSKIVLDALERTKSDEDIAFLKPAAESAIAILYSIRAIREGEVDDDFAGLALDACGLVFIIINECHKILQVSDQIPERFTWGSDELAAYLRDEVYVFVQKKIKRGFLKKHLMQAADDEKVVTSRDTLRKWTTKLEIQTGPSIHDTVETIISEKVSKHDQDAQAIRYARDADKLRQPQEQNQSPVQRLTNSPSTMHSTPNESIMQPSAQAEKLLPEIKIIDSTESEDKSGNVESQAIENGLELSPLAEKENDTRQKKKEMERQAKRAEREKWRRSEQEFSRLPYIPIQEDTPSRRSAEDLRPGSSGERSFSQGNRNQTSVYDEKRDLDLAAELQARLARELEEEDEQKALAIAIALHRQWEAEPEVATAAQAGHSRSSVQNRKHLTVDADSKRFAVDSESNKTYPWNKADRRRSGSSIGASLDEPGPSLKAT